jgi:hypothetical protein
VRLARAILDDHGPDSPLGIRSRFNPKRRIRFVLYARNNRYTQAIFQSGGAQYRQERLVHSEFGAALPLMALAFTFYFGTRGVAAVAIMIRSRPFLLAS